MKILIDSLFSLLQVLIVGLVLGAGLPALYAVGMRGLSMGRPVTADGAEVDGRVSLVGWGVAVVCFGLVVLAIALGIYALVFPKAVAHMLGGH